MTTMAENQRRKRIAAYLYDKGASIREIAELLGVPLASARNYVQPDRYDARLLVNQALADGHIKKPNACQDCSAEPKRLHAHHDNYNDPYGVRWLCPRCHRRVHPGPSRPKSDNQTASSLPALAPLASAGSTAQVGSGNPGLRPILSEAK